MADFTFMHSQWFAALIPLIIVLPWLKGKAQQSGLIAPHLAQKLGLTQQQPKRWPLALLALSWLIAVIAMAGPSWQKVKLPAYNLSGARVLVMNMSQSMYATDIKPNRLAQERFKALDMLPGWKEGSTGLVAFAGDGYEVSPLTTDSSTLRNLIPSLSPDVMPISGNNAAKGIAEAIRLLKQAGHNSGDIILMTDGMTKAVAQQALAELKGTHYRVSILAMGTVEGAPIMLPNGSLLSENGNPVISKIDISTLMSITDSTGGILQMAQTTDNDVNAIVNFTAKPLASGHKGHEKELQERLNGGFWLILPLLLLALLGFRRGIVLAAMFVLLPIDHAQASPWINTNRQAYETFTDGNFKKAAQDFTSPQWKGIAEYKAQQYDQAIATLKPLKDPTSQYNLGNAYAQKGDYKQAAATYEKVLKQQPDFADAKKNLAIVKQAEKQQQQQQQQQKKDKSGKQDQQGNKDQQQQGQQGNKDQQQQGQQSNKDQQQQGQQSNKDQQQQGQQDNKDQQQQGQQDNKDQQQQGQQGNKDQQQQGQQGNKDQQQQGQQGNKDQQQQGQQGNKDQQQQGQQQQGQQGNKDKQQQGQQGNKDKQQQGQHKSGKEGKQSKQQQQTNQQLGQQENQQQSMSEAEKKQQAKDNAQQAQQQKQDQQDGNKDNGQPSAVTMQQGKPNGDQQQVLSVSNPILKKLEQVPDDTAELIRAQLMLQAQQRAEQQQSNKSW
ncbi:VWA domain-containing protein [Photobacterium aquimaris]|uniref:Ribosomal RNA large subunit methyltransferase E n=1 Tax=Photobacterium aquimaris TaxID=512643 RepID=A0A1Y6KYM1_9GAMM|nr:VWA domain-containing protein [Photobacterium aquimaris]SMY16466.1 Ribosomal RNA large subunit methyltransferase E [Photobacterium aquimaris]